VAKVGTSNSHRTISLKRLQYVVENKHLTVLGTLIGQLLERSITEDHYCILYRTKSGFISKALITVHDIHTKTSKVKEKK
jgi:hypothetical protein